MEVEASREPVKPAWAFVIHINLNLTLWETHILLLIDLNPWFMPVITNELNWESTLSAAGNKESEPRSIELTKKRVHPYNIQDASKKIHRVCLSISKVAPIQ